MNKNICIHNEMKKITKKKREKRKEDLEPFLIVLMDVLRNAYKGFTKTKNKKNACLVS